jgi:hypothetical protein
MTARTGDAMLAADASRRAALSRSGGAGEGGQPRQMPLIEGPLQGRHEAWQCGDCTGAGACRIRNRYANTPGRPCWREWARVRRQGPAPKFRIVVI